MRIDDIDLDQYDPEFHDKIIIDELLDDSYGDMNMVIYIGA